MILDANDLVLLAHPKSRSPLHSQFFEVLTRDGKNCVARGNNRRQVVQDAIKYLEAKAVLTGQPLATGRINIARFLAK